MKKSPEQTHKQVLKGISISLFQGFKKSQIPEKFYLNLSALKNDLVIVSLKMSCKWLTYNFNFSFLSWVIEKQSSFIC